MFLLAAYVLSQLPPGVERRTLTVGERIDCPIVSQSVVCDDPTVVEPTVDMNGKLDQVIFIGRTPGVTTCACGPIRGIRVVWQITVKSSEQVVQETAAKIVDDARARLYRATAALVP